MSAAVYLDLESGAQRIALRAGEQAESESLGAVNSGDPETLEQFLLWAFDACPARRYVLVMAGLGIMDSDSVVGRPPFDAARLFAICDDRATNDAIELHELSAALKGAFPADGTRRLVMLACDMYAMQFMEVSYELRGVLDLIVGIQPDERQEDAPLPHWPYARCLQRWQEIVATPTEAHVPRWRSAVDPQGLLLAKETVALLAEHYTSTPAKGHAGHGFRDRSRGPCARRAGARHVQRRLSAMVEQRRHLAGSRDGLQKPHEDSRAIVELRPQRSGDGNRRIAEARIGRGGRPMGGRGGSSHAVPVAVAHAARDGLDRAQARGKRTERGRVSPNRQRDCHVPGWCRAPARRRGRRNPGRRSCPSTAEWTRAFALSSCDPANPEGVRDPAEWSAIIERARDRFTGAAARELADALDGIEAAKQLGRLAKRVSDLLQGKPDQQTVVAVWPPEHRCGLALYRPIDLDKLAESNYLELRFSRDLHWTALLTAVDLIKHHARMLWRLLESQLTAAPLEARYQLMRRLAGDRALTGRHADQLRALSAPDALFLTIDPADDDPASLPPPVRPWATGGRARARTIRSRHIASGSRRWTDRQPLSSAITRSRARAFNVSSRKLAKLAAISMLSPRERCSGWLNAAASWATMCFLASASISAT